MNSAKKPDISIIVVNYNVKEFLANCLQSVRRAEQDLDLEIIVVDNDSRDGSMDFLKPRFPEVTFIENSENVGFGKANNQAIKVASGKYTLLLNPDTIIQEDTLITLYKYMENNQECGACGCKILNPDGSFAPESRRSIPTVSTGLYKAIGLTSLFPKSKLFGAYYLGWKDEDEAGPVPVLSGSFMFFRAKVLKKLGGFDERFFMYGEDIDLCYRCREEGWRIDYVPHTSIIHYKGESAKKNNMAYIKHFNHAMYQFFDKHYTSRYSLLFRILVFIAIAIRAIGSFFFIKMASYRYIIYDLVILNVSLLLAFSIRFGFDIDRILDPSHLDFLWLNLLLTLLYILFAQVFGIIKSHPFSIVGSLKAVLSAFVGLTIVTFFIRTLAFSRMILIIGGVIAFVVVGFVRLMRVNMSGESKSTRGRFKKPKIFIAGAGDQTNEIIQKFHQRADWPYEIAGIIHQDSWESEEEYTVPVIGSLGNLQEMVQLYRVEHVIFLMSEVSHSELLSTISELRNRDFGIKIIPEKMDFLVGKAEVQYLDEHPLFDIDVTYFGFTQRLLKRILDLAVSVPIFLVLTIPALINRLKMDKPPETDLQIYNGQKQINLSLSSPITKAKWYNYWKLFGEVIRGNISCVGASLSNLNGRQKGHYKSGLTGNAQLNRKKIDSKEDLNRFDLYYLQNWTFWLDIDLLVKTLIYGPSPLEYISETVEGKG